jgi:hypothetical protein
MTTVWPAPAHVEALLALLPADDLAAFAALSGDPPGVILRGIAASSHAWCALEAGEPLCIGGVVPETLLGDVGRPWMVAQPGLARHPRRLLRESRAWLVELRRAYPVLRTEVVCGYPASLRWLGWLGFAIGEPRLIGKIWVREVML